MNVRMWRYFVLFALMIGWASGSYFEETEFDDPFMTLGRIAHTHSQGRDYNYYRNTVIGVCNTTSTGILNFGVCRGTVNCTIDGGSYSASGTNNCVWGNRCCIFSNSCGTTTYKKISYFVSPTVSSVTALPATCSYTVSAINVNICQVRLDFDQFEIANARQSTGINRCADDSFSVTTSNNAKIPTICGYNTGQHMYIPMNVSNGETSITLNFNLATRTTTTSTLVTPVWKIRVWQLECPYTPKAKGPNAEKDFLMLAPPGCLQYYTDRTGTIRNFGFNPSAATASNLYTANLDYSICFRREPSTCGFRLYPGTFLLSTAQTGTVCSADYLYIPEGILDAGGALGTYSNSKFCGTSPAAGDFVRSTGYFPAYVHFFTDGTLTAATEEIGFSLNYEIPPAGGC